MSANARPPFRWFRPILAGATLTERLIACAGALIGIGATGLATSLLLKSPSQLPLLIAPIGASAVLLFAVPTSPLAQPWPIIGGNTLSALCGVLVGHLVRDPWMATGIAVALAIAVMSFTRCLHPPGGAAALLGAIGIAPVGAAIVLYPVIPMAVNSIILVAVGLLFQLMTHRRYPHRVAESPIQLRVGIQPGDVDAALTTVGESFDINRDDLARLLRLAEQQSLARTTNPLRCEDIMSRDVIKIEQQALVEAARALLLKNDVRTLPVVNKQRQLVGAVGLRECTKAGTRVEDIMSAPKTAAAETLALKLLPALTDGSTHAIIIVNESGFVIGIVSQTDLLDLIGRPMLTLPTSEAGPRSPKPSSP
jgi:CBS domain-containing membrane protein